MVHKDYSVLFQGLNVCLVIYWNKLSSQFRNENHRFEVERNSFTICNSNLTNHSMTNILLRAFPMFIFFTLTVFNMSPVAAEVVFPSVSDLYPGSNGEANGSLDLQLPIQVTLTVLEPPEGGFGFTLPKVLPVMDLAVKDMNEKYQGRIAFRYAWGLGSCDRDVVGVEAARLSCSNNISVFIGPGELRSRARCFDFFFQRE